MEYQILNATEAARRFSDVLNQIKYRHAAFEVRRGGVAVARIVPAGPTGLPVASLNQLVAALPALTGEEADAFAADIRAARAQTTMSEPAWD